MELATKLVRQFEVNGVDFGMTETIATDAEVAAGEIHFCSYTIFCRYCGKVFATVSTFILRDSQHFGLRDIQNFPLPFQGIGKCCKLCKGEHQYDIPGSIYSSYDENFNQGLPAALLRREVELHLRYAEQKDKN